MGVGIWGIRVGMRGMQRFRVGIDVEMQEIRVGMWESEWKCAECRKSKWKCGKCSREAWNQGRTTGKLG